MDGVCVVGFVMITNYVCFPLTFFSSSAFDYIFSLDHLRDLIAVRNMPYIYFAFFDPYTARIVCAFYFHLSRVLYMA